MAALALHKQERVAKAAAERDAKAAQVAASALHKQERVARVE